MRWILKPCDTPILTRPTRPPQNWSWRRRDAAPVPDTTGTAISCLTTVVLRDAILDFEAYAVVIQSRRHFLPVRLFTMFATLLMAEDEELSTARLAVIGKTEIPTNIVDGVNRDIQQIRRKLGLAEAGFEIIASRRGYTFRRVHTASLVYR